MTFKRTLGVVAMAASVAVLAAGTLLVPEAAYAGGKARGKLYSTAAVNRFCKEAQMIIANTDLAANNVIWDDLGTPGVPFPVPIPATGFIGSNATPYGDVGTPSAELPLTSQQYVGYGYYENGKDYPQTIMCKMKSWDALQAYYGVDAASAGASCRDINQVTLDAVVNSLTNDNQEPLVTDIVLEDDWVAYAGNQWTFESPATTAYRIEEDGPVHVLGKSLYVDKNNTSPFVGPEKKGVHYCQVIGAEYLREILIGNISPAECSDPPPLGPPFLWPPGPPPTPTWGCPNP